MTAVSSEVGSAAAAAQARLAHLFRLSLQQNRIHPLYLPLQKYRQAQADSQAASPP